MTAERKVGVDSLLERDRPELFEARDLRLRERLVDEVGERGARARERAPRGARPRRRRVPSCERRAPLLRQAREAVDVHLLRIELEHVARRARGITRPERLPELRDVDLDGVGGRLGRFAGPEASTSRSTETTRPTSSASTARSARGFRPPSATAPCLSALRVARVAVARALGRLPRALRPYRLLAVPERRSFSRTFQAVHSPGHIAVLERFLSVPAHAVLVTSTRASHRLAPGRRVARPPIDSAMQRRPPWQPSSSHCRPRTSIPRLRDTPAASSPAPRHPPCFRLASRSGSAAAASYPSQGRSTKDRRRWAPQETRFELDVDGEPAAMADRRHVRGRRPTREQAQPRHVRVRAAGRLAPVLGTLVRRRPAHPDEREVDPVRRTLVAGPPAVERFLSALPHGQSVPRRTAGRAVQEERLG